MQSFSALLAVLVFYISLTITSGDHFRGGTISWRQITGNTVQFSFKLGWTYNRGPGCTAAKLGQLVTNMINVKDNWMCTTGCGGPTSMASVNYICTSASKSEGWEQGENTFIYTFPGLGPYTVSYTGRAWMKLDNGVGKDDWNIQTIVDLHPRSDTGKPNVSPITMSKPLYHLQFGCNHTLPVPMADEDGDNIRCRWSTGVECKYVCKALPFAKLDPATCTLEFTADAGKSYKAGHWYAVALTIEDFPQTRITMNGKTYETNTSISSTPLQFLIKTPAIKNVPCDSKPEFIPPTPAESSTTRILQKDTLVIRLYAANTKDKTAKVTSIQVNLPKGATQSALHPDPSKPGEYYTEVTWTPTKDQAGETIMCAMAEDSNTKTSEPRCFSLRAWAIDPCASSPCSHGTCVAVKSTFTCTCSPGYKGITCNINIDECKSAPCQNGGSCTDMVNGYTCSCVPGFTGSTCQTDIDECTSAPCHNGGSCSDMVNGYTCSCVPGFTGSTCQTDIDECKSAPCQNGGSCTDMVNGYTCSCVPGFTGSTCQTDIDECKSAPCQNGGSCSDMVNGYTCSCVPGFTGSNCQTDIDECKSAPCQNGGSCSDMVNRYTCSCVPGFTGSTCQIDIDECQSGPCENGGTCVDDVATYRCTCMQGYTGHDCQTRVDHCASKPCKNSGLCIGTPIGYSCICDVSWQGPNCDVKRNSNPSSLPITSIEPGCEPEAYSDCSCYLGQGFSNSKNHDSSNQGSLGRDIIAGLIGFPFGLGLGIAFFYLLRSCGPCRNVPTRPWRVSPAASKTSLNSRGDDNDYEESRVKSGKPGNNGGALDTSRGDDLGYRGRGVDRGVVGQPVDGALGTSGDVPRGGGGGGGGGEGGGRDTATRRLTNIYRSTFGDNNALTIGNKSHNSGFTDWD